MKRIVIVFGLCLTAYSLVAESRFTYGIPKDIILGGLTLGVFIPPLFISGSPGEAVTDNRDGVNGFDRELMFPYHKVMDITSDVAASLLAAVPVISLIGNITDLSAVAAYGIMYGEAFLLTFGTLELIKDLTDRNRPYTYFGDISADQEEDYYNSFASRHTALAFMSAGFFTYTFCAEYPDSAWKIPAAALSYAAAAGIGALRITSGNHFLSDVLVGAAIGSVYGYLIPILHIRKPAIASGVTVTPLPTGFLINWKLP